MFLSEHLDCDEPDSLASMPKTSIEALMGAEADALCGAPYGVRTDERVNSRNWLPGPGVRDGKRLGLGAFVVLIACLVDAGQVL
jgi:hypothetical protein